MYSLLSNRDIIKTIFVLLRANGYLNESSKDLNFFNLRSRYLTFLFNFQSALPKYINKDINYLMDDDEIHKVAKLFLKESMLNDLNQSSAADYSIKAIQENKEARLKAYELFENSLQKFKKLDPDWEQIISLHLGCVFFVPSTVARGGSNSHCIGLIWFSPHALWSEIDYLEFLVHESTHQAMFLDELRFRHYKNYQLINQPNTFAFSSVLGLMRPLDKVLHSLVVAVEILKFRKIHTGLHVKIHLHPKTTVLLSQAIKTINFFNLNKDKFSSILTKRAFDLINNSEETIQSI